MCIRDRAFSLGGINSSPARLDFDKMDFINAQHMTASDDAALLTAAMPFLEAANEGPLSDNVKTRILNGMTSLTPRAKTLIELAEQARYLMDIRPIEVTGKKAKPLKREGAVELLSALTRALKSHKEFTWTPEALQAKLVNFAEEREIGFGRVGQPVRAALTGGAPSPDLSIVLALLGQDEVLGRLDDAIASFTVD